MTSSRSGGWRELSLVMLGAAIFTAALTHPIAFKLGHVGRIDNGDGQLSIWNVAWVARTLVADPLHVFDANIFYPHLGTLAYSENNLGAGALAVPVYWATRNPYAALNSALLLAFILSATGTYYLVRYLTGDRRAAAVSAVLFAFCPYAFAHTAHIQLLMTAGLPFSMLAFHRMADKPGAGRGATLGAAMAAQAIACGYYGVFVFLMVGFAFIVVATARGQWLDRRTWLAGSVAAAVAILLVTPAFLPYWNLQRAEGLQRKLGMAARYSAHWSDYLASSAYAHAWMLHHLPPWTEVSFPGLLGATFGIAGGWIARREGRGEILALYGGLVVVALWASFGPQAGLYSALYNVLPFFGWLRAPARFSLIVGFGAAVLAGFAVAAWLRHVRHPGLVAAGLVLVAAGELAVPLNMPEVPPVEPVYLALAPLPRGPVIEMPFFYLPEMFPRHTRYMLSSTTHWMPLVNGYSDYIPPDFTANVATLAPFPSRDAFKLLEPNHVRYAIFHMYWYNTENTRDVLTRLTEFEPYLRPIYVDAGTRLYEIVGFPP